MTLGLLGVLHGNLNVVFTGDMHFRCVGTSPVIDNSMAEHESKM